MSLFSLFPSRKASPNSTNQHATTPHYTHRSRQHQEDALQHDVRILLALCKEKQQHLTVLSSVVDSSRWRLTQQAVYFAQLSVTARFTKLLLNVGRDISVIDHVHAQELAAAQTRLAS